ncbi:immunoglobulin-like domain-containing protein [Listeria booriae]|uniref:immunoglobulin-like domain-containing protein n=1 Tax=Listeria booriae TaxID=1552123 RepID=UPI0016238F69|nr:immunoglobulin-like domain-containing protein [Listeria booriae]MBC2327800.1 hypothetical protein [Listeria booriae]
MKKNTKKVLLGLLAFNVLASAPLTTISANAAETVATNNAGEVVKSSLKATSTNLLKNTQFNGLSNWEVSVHNNGVMGLSELNVPVNGINGVWNNVTSKMFGNNADFVMPNNNGSVRLRTDVKSSIFLDQQVTVIPGHKYQLSYNVRGYAPAASTLRGTVVNYSENWETGYSYSEDPSKWGEMLTKQWAYDDIGEKSHTIEFTPAQKTVWVHLYSSGLNGSAYTDYSNIKLVDTTVLPNPVVSPVNSTDTSMQVKGEPGASITIALPDGTAISKTASANGEVTFIIPKQEAGAEISVTQTLNGATGATTATVGLKAPTISSVNDKSTSVTVTGDPSSNITINLPDGSRTTKTANAQGQATFNVSGLVADQVIQASQSKNGQTSPLASTTVQATALNAPTIAPFTTADTQLVVTGEAGARISVKLPDGSDMNKTAGADGKATFNIGTQDFGAVIEATQTGSNGKTSAPASIKVTQGVVAKPTINPVTTDSTTLTGTGIPGATIQINIDGVIQRATVAPNGTYSFTIEKQVVNMIIGANQVYNGVTSGSVQVSVTQGIVAKPKVNAITTDSTTVTGTGIPEATVQIKIKDVLYTDTVKSDGTYSITIPKQTAGSPVVANQVYNGVESDSIGTFVMQGAVAAPTINALTTDDTTVTGTGITGASVKVKANNIDYTGTVKADGTYSIAIPKQAANTVVTATQTLYNVTSSAVSTTVTAKAAASTLTAGDFTIGADNYIKGTYTGDIAKLAIEVNGILQQTINATGSPYQYYAKGKVNAATDQVYVIGYDATGKQLQKTKVNVKQQTVGTITPNTFYIGSENYVTGKLSGNVAKFSMTVNGVEYSKINVTTAPDFKYYANNLITNITDIVKVNAYDASGKLLDSKPVSVTTYQGEEGKITSVAPFKLGKDSYVTGAYTGDVKKVELQVNGVALQRINVTGGTIKYYAKANITKTTDEVKLVGYNTAGVAVSTKTISVSAADGTVTANPFVIGKDGYVTGKYTGDVAKISLTVNGVKQTTINVPAGSDYQYYAKTLIKNASDVVVLTAYDAVGGVLDTANVAVSDSKATTSGTVTPSAFKLGTDAYVDGTYTGDVAKVELEVNDVKYGQIPATGNTIHYYAASLITKASDVVKVNVYDTAGKQLDSKTVSVVAPTGTVVATTVKVGDSYLRGTATGDVTKVALSVNGTVQTSVAFVQPDGSYQYYIKNLNLKATDDVKVIGMDARGNTINTSDVTITN